ncbi:Lrp/AsnC family transcriptional regulator [Burkholderia glumae]|uniref:Lrp/AsnC family transcriptional regulator n=1 Tax=Burkholderia glumae TaxID=337 RepID=UPI00129576F8|nr:Lrp/AsnC family transcriptional regulator [Burkholderia glumae]MCM2551586.1 Lrp/AsnC family transcriptional regulator [Burkholderia glumae]QGA39528.1 winged helix-turn-helix transcriptional regulator [Burkholderia glumae]
MKKASPRVEIDATDMKILQIVQDKGRLSNAELAEQVSLSPSPCWKRLRRLESSGVIRGYRAELDRHVLGFNVVAFVSISLDSHTQKVCRAFEAGVMAMSEVVACHNTTGAHDYLLQILVEDFERYSEFVLDRLSTLPGVKEMLSTVSMRELKSSSKLALR